jgi:hypothetical protein
VSKILKYGEWWNQNIMKRSFILAFRNIVCFFTAIYLWTQNIYHRKEFMEDDTNNADLFLNFFKFWRLQRSLLDFHLGRMYKIELEDL